MTVQKISKHRSCPQQHKQIKPDSTLPQRKVLPNRLPFFVSFYLVSSVCHQQHCTSQIGWVVRDTHVQYSSLLALLDHSLHHWLSNPDRDWKRKKRSEPSTDISESHSWAQRRCLILVLQYRYHLGRETVQHTKFPPPSPLYIFTRLHSFSLMCTSDQWRSALSTVLFIFFPVHWCNQTNCLFYY